MKKIFLPLLPVLFIGALIFAVSGCSEKKPDREQMSRASYYNDFIKEVVNVSPKQLGLKLPDSEITVYGVITEQNIGDLLVVVTAAYSTGEAVDIAYGGSCFVNMAEKGSSSGISELAYNNAKKYLKYYQSDIDKYWKDKSTNVLAQNLLMTLFINPESNREIRDEVKKFIETAQNSINSMTEVEKDGSLPAAGKIKIIFLTNKGRYFVEGTMGEIAAKDPAFRQLFKARSDISDIVFRNFAAVSVR